MTISRNLIAETVVMLRLLIRSSLKPGTTMSAMAFTIVGQLEATIAAHDKLIEIKHP